MLWFGFLSVWLWNSASVVCNLVSPRQTHLQDLLFNNRQELIASETAGIGTLAFDQEWALSNVCLFVSQHEAELNISSFLCIRP